MTPGKEVSYHTSHGTRKCSATARAPRYDGTQHAAHAAVHSRSKGAGASQDPVQEVFTALTVFTALLAVSPQPTARATPFVGGRS